MHCLRGPKNVPRYLANRIRAARNVVIHEHTEIRSVEGKSRIEAVTLDKHDTDAPTSLPCAAVFVFIGAEPCAEWLPDEIARDQNGYVLTGSDVLRSGKWPRQDRDPCPLETTVPGILAAGDIRAGVKTGRRAIA